jgi:hypothetical protein
MLVSLNSIFAAAHRISMWQLTADRYHGTGSAIGHSILAVA